MPTYEYACRSGGEHLEVVQSFKDDPLTECPACSGQLRKVFSPIGISFKGSGFYKTDSRGGSAKPAAASGDAASTTSTTEKPAATSTSSDGSSSSASGSSSGSGSSSSSSSTTAAAS